MTNAWEVVDDGYHKHVRLVQSADGKIIGHVRGENYNSTSEWSAHANGIHLGHFVTEGQAKKAVELACGGKG